MDIVEFKKIVDESIKKGFKYIDIWSGDKTGIVFHNGVLKDEDNEFIELDINYEEDYDI